ncbi:unnamed protein product [Caenorhabditis brenneri]
MERVKFIMMLLHLTCFWLDIYFNILTIPYIILPVSSGYPLGPLLFVGVPTSVMVYIGITSLYFFGCTLMISFEDRYHHLVRRGGSSSWQRKLFFVINYSLVFFCALPTFYGIPSIEEARQIFQEEFPCIPNSILEKPGFFMLTKNSTILVASLAGYLMISGSQAFFFIWKTSEYLFKIKAQSQRTSQMQRQFFKALCIQASVPLLAFIAPCLYIQISTALNYLDMIFSNFASIWLASHGIFATITMIIVHKPYREATLILIKCQKSGSTVQLYKNSVPLDLFGTYLVYFETPITMKKVKFIMMLLHLTCFWLDIFINVLTVPYIILPVSSGYPLGLLFYVGVPTSVLTYIGITSLYFFGCILMVSFEDRYHHLVRRGSTATWQRKLFFVINYSLVFLCALPTFYGVPTVDEARQIIHNGFPCIPRSILEKPGFFMLTKNSTILVASLAGYLMISGSQAFFFIWKTSEYLFKIKAQSQRTSQMQRQFFKALCIQASVPLLAFIAPCLYIQISTALDYLDMILSNFAFIWLTSHGILATITMIIVHKPYREATLIMIKCQKSVSTVPSYNDSVTRL